jgi:hypothetical protein
MAVSVSDDSGGVAIGPDIVAVAGASGLSNG